MANKPRKKHNEKPYEEGSLLHFADLSLGKLQSLSRSSMLSDKLIALDALIIVVLMAIFTTHFMIYPDSPFSLASFIIFVITFVLVLILAGSYTRLLDVLINTLGDKVYALRIGIIVLFINLPIAVGGLIFSSPSVIKASIGILVFHFIAIPFSAIVKIPNIGENDKTVNSSQLWTVLGKINSITGIACFIVMVIELLIKAAT